MAKELKTGWLCLATSGTVTHGKEDGRFIKKEWLTDMAETFDLSVHTPCIWPDHYRYYNFGKVIALKTEPVLSGALKGEIQLFGILSPNNALIQANQDGQYCYPSIEVGENFHGTGKYFLKAIGVTDEPASTGVSELRFNKQSVNLIAGDKFNVNDHITETVDEPGAFKKLINHIFKATPNTDSPQHNINPSQDDSEMNQEQFNELKTGIAALTTAVTGMAEKFSTQPAPVVPPVTQPAPVVTEPAPAAPTAAEFKAMQDQLTAFKAQLDEAMKTPQPGTQTAPGTGEAAKGIL